MRVLLVEDDALLAKATARGLDQAGFVVDIAGTAEHAYHFLGSYHYHFILLDLGLPDRNGIEILKSLRRKRNKAGIIILTAQDQIEDRIAGLEAGADDFVVKPYDLHEVVARIHAVLRRISGEVSDLILIGNISINKASKRVLLDQVEVELTHKEFHLLELLTLNRGRVISRENIENSFYTYDADISSNVVQVYIHNLRRKLGKNIVRTVQGFGYVMDEQH
ncbi:DNA-binding response regulator [Acinetobacter sp. WCHAc010034]|uniref:response regulator n=1 Tax=Acinetobacter sp. WCHAc010034 TaxID=1879049 RepID=UPI00083B67A0|nr:response regulator [Acinetobacter sp. WCHAc010034]AYA02448.1 DNA-binding response regulator [Acinetobacter sp. WCHAc010034]MBL8323031.1 response regulator [Acinetobacter sp.]